LKRLDAHFELPDKHPDISMLEIWHFAITSTRPEDEICRQLWEDNHEYAPPYPACSATSSRRPMT
jgi:hypothetical protein